LPPRGYGVVTLHRPSNVDDRAQLELIVAKLVAIAKTLPLVFPVHPRTRQRLTDFGLLERLQTAPDIRLAEPLSYVAFMSLVLDSRLALTDSGGVQEETSYLGIPCLTLRENTERPVTVTLGTNRLTTPARIDEDVASVLAGPVRTQCRIPRWDGRTAARVAASLRRRAFG
jgi:UDP-N-acetylglucosamine 2-epimerase (non-hydrolysing)